MINLNLKYNNDDEKKSKKELEIKGIGNQNCWIKKMDFRIGGWFIGGRPKILIMGDHLFLNYKTNWAVAVD